MTIRRNAWAAALTVLVIIGGSTSALGQSGGVGIDAEPVPGQLDLLQETAIQLGGKPDKGGPEPSSYRWEIVGGEGGTLLKADQPEAIFQAPAIEQDLVLFVVQLTVEYPVQKPSRARLHIRVHRELPGPTIEQKMADLYDKEEARRQERKKNRSQTTVVHNVYPSWHSGYSWGWGRPIYYPVYVPIILPPPGIDWEPGSGEWVEPAPLPFDELVTEFPEHIANDYLPQDHPLADDMPDTAFIGNSPADFIEPPDFIVPPPGVGGLDSPGFVEGPGFMDDPGFGGMDFAEPMIDPDFGFDDFGW